MTIRKVEHRGFNIAAHQIALVAGFTRDKRESKALALAGRLRWEGEAITARDVEEDRSRHLFDRGAQVEFLSEDRQTVLDVCHMVRGPGRTGYVPALGGE